MGRKNPYYRVIFILFLIVYGTSLNAQLDSISYSPKFPFEKKDFTRSIVSSGDFLLTVNQDDQPSEMQFSIFKKETLALVNEFNWSKQGLDYINHEIKIVEYFDGQILLLSTSISGDKKNRFLWLTSLAPDGTEIKHLKLKETTNKTRNPSFTFELFKNSQDTHLGLSMVLENEKEFLLDIFLLDLSLSIIKEKQIQLGNIKKVNYPHSFMLSDNGFIFFLNGLSEEKNAAQTEIGLENRLYQLYRYNPDNDKIKQYDVTIADKFISDVKMRISAMGDLYIAGFYNKSIQKGAEGVFLMVIDKDDGSISLSGKRALDKRVISDFLTEKQIKRTQVVEDLFLDHLYVDDQGNLTLISEVFFIEQRLITSANGINVTTSLYYNWGDVLVLNMDKSLNYLAHETIRKRQKSTNYISPYWSYSLIEKDDGNKSLLFNYTANRKKGGGVTITSPSRAVTWYHPLFSFQPNEMDTPKQLNVAPLFAPIWYGSFGILQDKHDFGLFKIIPSNN